MAKSILYVCAYNLIYVVDMLTNYSDLIVVVGRSIAATFCSIKIHPLACSIKFKSIFTVYIIYFVVSSN